MAKEAGNTARILVGLSNPPTTPLGSAYDIDDDEQPIKADATTNDSEGDDEHAIIGTTRKLTCKVKTDRADAGQTICRTAKKTLIYVAFQEAGEGDGLPQEIFLASVVFKRSNMLRTLKEASIEFERSGSTIDDTAQVVP